LVAAAKFLVAATKNLFVVPNFVAVTKHFFYFYESLVEAHLKFSKLLEKARFKFSSFWSSH